MPTAEHSCTEFHILLAELLLLSRVWKAMPCPRIEGLYRGNREAGDASCSSVSGLFARIHDVLWCSPGALAILRRRRVDAVESPQVRTTAKSTLKTGCP